MDALLFLLVFLESMVIAIKISNTNPFIRFLKYFKHTIKFHPYQFEAEKESIYMKKLRHYEGSMDGFIEDYGFDAFTELLNTDHRTIKYDKDRILHPIENSNFIPGTFFKEKTYQDEKFKISQEYVEDGLQGGCQADVIAHRTYTRR